MMEKNYEMSTRRIDYVGTADQRFQGVNLNRLLQPHSATLYVARRNFIVFFFQTFKRQMRVVKLKKLINYQVPEREVTSYQIFRTKTGMVN